MKRGICVLLSVVLMLSLAACAGGAKDWQEQYDLGMRYLDDGDYEEAILAFTAAIEIDGSRPEAYLGRADAYIAIGEPEKALQDLKRARRAARNSDGDYEDMIEDLDDRIDKMEEEIGTEGTQSPAGAEDEIPTEPENITALVTDAYTKDFVTEYGAESCCHIPRINLDGDRAAGVNAEIYEELSRYIESEADEVVYTWGTHGDLLSVLVQADHIDWDWTDYYVYTISMTTGERVSQQELLRSYDLDMESYYALAYATLEAELDAFTPDENSMEAYQHVREHTLAQENIEKSVPFICANGHLGMVAAKYSIAGAEYYYGIYDLTEGKRLSMLTPPDDAAGTYTVEEINQLVAQWYESNPNFQCDFLLAESLFKDESDTGDGMHYVHMCFVNPVPARATELLVRVDMQTGEMWEMYEGQGDVEDLSTYESVSIGYLW